MAYKVGQRAETLAAAYLEERGFQIIDRNWRNRWCEIDLVARGGAVIHIIEVKFRSNPDYGSGFEYITADKLRRLKLAAEYYMASRDQPYQIDVVAVSGQNIELIENVTA